MIRAAVAVRYGDGVASSLRLLPVNRMPLTEQGKPDRTAIRAAASTALGVS